MGRYLEALGQTSVSIVRFFRCFQDGFDLLGAQILAMTLLIFAIHRLLCSLLALEVLFGALFDVVARPGALAPFAALASLYWSFIYGAFDTRLACTVFNELAHPGDGFPQLDGSQGPRLKLFLSELVLR